MVQTFNILAIMFGLTLLAQSSAAAEPAKHLSIELNTAAQTQKACRLAFVATNQPGATIDALSTEVVLFGQDGGVLRLALFDFKSIPDGKSRVRQFDVPDTQCLAISKTLINDVKVCTGPIGGASICAAALKLSSKLATELF